MQANNESRSFFEYITAFLIIAGVVIYLSGFFIVNAYLSKFHLADIETVNLGIFQPAYITAGIMYFVIYIISFTLTIPTAYKIYEFLNERYQAEIQGTDWMLLSLKYLPSLLLHSAIGVLFTAIILVYAIRSSESLVSHVVELLLPLSIVILLQSFLTSLPLTCFFLLRNKLNPSIKFKSIPIAILLFMFAHSYALLTTAESIYEKLPVIVGGGQQRTVIFSVKSENARALDLIDNNFTKKIIDIPSDTTDEILQTNKLILFWQFGSANFAQNETEAVYFIRPLDCDECPIVQIPKSSVYGVIYLETP
jgi:hypothetical protein